METDLLQIKIDKAKSSLAEETKMAIDNVNWKTEVLKMRETKGYSFEQLETLEIETELLLCGLLDPVNYPKELETRMHLPKEKANELVEEMNKLVFQKIRAEMIKNIAQKERERTKKPEISFQKTEEIKTRIEKIPEIIEKKNDIKMTNNTSIEVMSEELPTGKKIERPTNISMEKEDLLAIPKSEPSISAQKLSSSFQIPTIKTEHLDNMKNTSNMNLKIPTPSMPPKPPQTTPTTQKNTGYKVDPYRTPIE